MTDAPTTALHGGIWARLRRRKVVQWGLAYAAGAWTLLQGLHYAVEIFRWPESIRPTATIAAVVGLPIALVVAWYHGDRGEQRATRAELAIIVLLLLAGGAVLWRYGGDIQQTHTAVEAIQTVPTAAPGTAYSASVAVLPFKALSSGTDDEYFADGLTEEIINALATLPDVLVTARTSAFHFKGKDVPVPQVAAALGVAHVVEGSVRRSGDKARITAQLIRASDGFNVWTQTYDHSMGDPFAVQTRIAESVAGALGVLLDESRRKAMSEAGVRDVEAFVAYQRGEELFNRAHNDGPMLPLLARANGEFDRAIARKPDFAAAYFHRSDYYAHFLIDEAPGKGPGLVTADGLGIGEAARRLTADLEAAFRYERDPAQRRVIQVLRTTVSQDWRHLDDQIRTAFEGWNNCRHGLWIDQTAISFGYGEAALEHDIRRRRCDPLAHNWTREAVSAIWIGRPLDGLKYADRIESKRGQDRDVMYARILAYLALGRLADAEVLYSAGNFDAADVPESHSLLSLMVPAAAGRAAHWQALKPALASDPGRLLVGAAIFGDRDAANRAAAEVDAMTIGPAILLRVTDRCGCGSPFDLSATPKLARQLREGGLTWSPPRPIDFPLKTW